MLFRSGSGRISTSAKRSNKDRICLPAFTFAPSSKTTWDGKGRPGDKDVNAMVKRMGGLVQDGLLAEDLTLSWLYRRVCPLQSRAHKMFRMSGRYDPTRLSPKNYTTESLDSWLWMITKGHAGADWGFGLPPYNRKHPAPKVNLFAIIIAFNNRAPADVDLALLVALTAPDDRGWADRKSTRLNSSHPV